MRADPIPMERPVWLFSLDTDQFQAPPLTTGGLKSFYLARGKNPSGHHIELVHFRNLAELATWVSTGWPDTIREQARRAIKAGVQPVFGFSCYTWNVAEFIEIARLIKGSLPDALVIAGGPHVQRADDFLRGDGFDIIVQGEGEETFTELLDCSGREAWPAISGLAFLDGQGNAVHTPPRARTTDLGALPSALDVLELRDEHGEPRYQHVAYETARGCPYKCAFCEWGTGAIGTKMYSLPIERIRSDLEKLVAGGIHDIWLCDSNFGALREDEEKAEVIIDLRRRTGRPHTFATSWSKNHNQRVQRMVRRLHANGLLVHYHLALQTLTPLALELSNRTNMRANDYEPIARSLAAEGVPIAAELIWGLPGDNLADFEANLTRLFAVFPAINIFAYTLLPGTEFFDRREEYGIEAVPIMGYGKAKGEYVVGCSSFSRDEGEEGYLLVTAHVCLTRGHVLPLTIRDLALEGGVSVGALLRTLLRGLLAEYQADSDPRCATDRLFVYENRAPLYLRWFEDLDRTYGRLSRDLTQWLTSQGREDLIDRAQRTLLLDRALSPKMGKTRNVVEQLPFRADLVEATLRQMTRPTDALVMESEAVALEIRVPGGVGDVLQDPDGGSWMRGAITTTTRDATATPLELSLEPSAIGSANPSNA